MGFFHALSAVSVLLMLMSVGYFMGVKGWMTTREKRFVSRYIVNIAVPCNCVVGLLDNLSHNDLAQAGLLVASGVLGVGVTLLNIYRCRSPAPSAAEAVGRLCGYGWVVQYPVYWHPGLYSVVWSGMYALCDAILSGQHHFCTVGWDFAY